MTIDRWHPGKLVLLWFACAVVSCGAVGVGAELEGEGIVRDVLLIMWAGPWIAAFVVTWRWFTTRERTSQKRGTGDSGDSS